jgi:hypothetical protein
VRKWLFFAAACAVILLALGAQNATVSFTMAFVKRTPEGLPARVDFSERVNIAPEDAFKIFLQPSAGSYVYLVLHDAQNDVQLLFPQSFTAFESPGYAQGRTFIPAGDDWFALDGTKGTERFYLLASVERLRTLESRIAAYQKAVSRQSSTTTAIGAARQAVLDEIRQLIKSHSGLAAAAEKPVTVGGGTRGTTEAVERLATRIEAGPFYSRTFRLDH